MARPSRDAWGGSRYREVVGRNRKGPGPPVVGGVGRAQQKTPSMRVFAQRGRRSLVVRPSRAIAIRNLSDPPKDGKHKSPRASNFPWYLIY